MVVIGGFSIVRTLFPNVTPNVGALLSEPHKYFLANYRPCAAWAFAVFISACGIGFGGGSWIKPGGGSLDTSAWWEMFEVESQKRKFVSCQLLDGSFISGELYSFSTDCDETENRELVLLDPLFLAAGAEGDPESMHSDLTSISSRRILYMSVNLVASDSADRAERRLRTRAGEAWKVLLGKATVADAALEARD
jgi:hypothetical protein